MRSKSKSRKKRKRSKSKTKRRKITKQTRIFTLKNVRIKKKDIGSVARKVIAGIFTGIGTTSIVMLTGPLWPFIPSDDYRTPSFIFSNIMYSFLISGLSTLGVITARRTNNVYTITWLSTKAAIMGVVGILLAILMFYNRTRPQAPIILQHDPPPDNPPGYFTRLGGEGRRLGELDPKPIAFAE